MPDESKTRPLNDDEKQLILKNLKKLMREQNYLNYQTKYLNLMLRTGLWQNYLRQRDELENKIREAKKELITIKEMIKTSDIQLKKGVTIKKGDTKNGK